MFENELERGHKCKKVTIVKQMSLDLNLPRASIVWAADGGCSLTRRRNLGSYYTPALLANWVAATLLRFLDSRQEIRILDPACGDGSLLKAVSTQSAVPTMLIGRDIDPEALLVARRVLGEHASLELGDSVLCEDCKVEPERTVDAIIANPPWGATLPYDRSVVTAAGLALARGQFDAYELFVERAIKFAKPGCICAFILPESLLLPEHEPLRRLLLSRTQILLLARLGEGLFAGVFRDTVVLVFRNSHPSSSHLVTCFPLRPKLKSQVHSGEVKLDEAYDICRHAVPQQRFQHNPRAEFDISVRVEDVAPMKAARITQFDWDERVLIRRGVEIGKHGMVHFCSKCMRHQAFSLVGNSTCRMCNTTVTSRLITVRSVSQGEPPGKWQQLIVGEDVQRYSCGPSRYVRADLDGIRYNDMSHYANRKLLIRKTGVGLRAAMDITGSFVTQTVFTICCRGENEDWILDYLQGLLNSRCLLALHLSRTGDNQWRSHPYVTPKIIRTLPMPDPTHSPTTLELAQRVAAMAAQLRSKYDIALDCQLEEVVQKLFCFDSADVSWVSNVIRDTGELKYFKSLRASPSK